MSKNVLGTPLESCGHDPVTGYIRDGSCHTGDDDYGSHVICAVMTKEFLEFSYTQGNDLITPQPLVNFPGLTPGDRWCVCAGRWKDAMEYGVAPPVMLMATNMKALEVVSLENLLSHSYHDSTS